VCISSKRDITIDPFEVRAFGSDRVGNQRPEGSRRTLRLRSFRTGLEGASLISKNSDRSQLCPAPRGALAKTTEDQRIGMASHPDNVKGMLVIDDEAGARLTWNPKYEEWWNQFLLS
jgi:hypothetical protein